MIELDVGIKFSSGCTSVFLCRFIEILLCLIGQSVSWFHIIVNYLAVSSSFWAVFLLIQDAIAVLSPILEVQYLNKLVFRVDRWSLETVFSIITSLLYVSGSRTIAIHLFDRLGDEELTNRVEASALFAKLGTMFLPILADLWVFHTGRFFLEQLRENI